MTTAGTRPPIRVLDLSGSPGQIGRRHGEAHGAEIRTYAAERIALVAGGAWSGGPLDRADVLDLAGSMVPANEAFDAAMHEELLAMAEAAGITPAEAIVVGGFTDFVDTVRAELGGPTPAELVEDDCTAVLVPTGRAADGHAIYGQTWDMHDLATDHVLLLRIDPDDGPPAVVFTTTGCVGQIGMNAEGVCVGINNLSGLDGTRGVTWPTVVRRMLRCDRAADALAVLLDADLAGAHNFCILDRHGTGHNVEAMPSVRASTPLRNEPLVHTNHTLDPATSTVEVDRDPILQANSAERHQTATAMLADGPIDAERVMDVTREPTAICQKSAPPFHIESSGATVMRPATGDFWACWGRPEENPYVKVELPGR
ncbi:MAG: C45 family peptidase [Actinomycetota bacterium]